MVGVMLYVREIKVAFLRLVWNNLDPYCACVKERVIRARSEPALLFGQHQARMSKDRDLWGRDCGSNTR